MSAISRIVPRSPGGRVVAAALAIGLALLVADHWLHVLGALPVLVILACPLAHLLMHSGHGEHRHGDKAGRG